MTEWVSCPKCGALMIGLTGSHICPLCGYRLPVQTITYTTGTEKYGEYVEVIRCKDCKYWLPHSQFGFDEDNEEYYDYCELLVPDDDYYAITRQAEDFCSRAERKEECSR